MTIKHNQKIERNHFRKDWQRRVRTHFDQPGRKLRRRHARQIKVAKVAPRPLDKLRPIVRCSSTKYNRRLRAGRGFSLQELKAAGVSRKLAPTIGIAVDPRRQNISEESLTPNVERIKEYMSRLVLFPRRNGKQKSGDASASDVKAAKADGVKLVQRTNKEFPIPNIKEVTEMKLSEVEGEENAYRKLRLARSDARLVGVREKRAKIKAEEAAAQKK